MLKIIDIINQDVVTNLFEVYKESMDDLRSNFNSDCEMYKTYEEFLKDFYTTYFLKTIENIPILWDKRNTFGLFRKIIKAQKILLSEEYAVCYRKMDKSRFNKLSLLVYGSRFLPLVLFLLRK